MIACMADEARDDATPALAATHSPGRIRSPLLATALLWWVRRGPVLWQQSPRRRAAVAARAVAIRRASPGVPSRAVAEALTVLGGKLVARRNWVEAEAAGREAVALYADDSGVRPADAHLIWAFALCGLNRYEEGLATAQTALAHYRRPDTRPSWRLTCGIASSLFMESVTLARLGRHDEALPLAQESVRRFEELPIFRRASVASAYVDAQVHLVSELGRAGRYQEAITVGEDALSTLDTVVRLVPTRGLEPRAGLCGQLAQCHGQVDDPHKGVEAAERSVADYRRLGGAHRNNLAWALEIYAQRLSALDRTDDADAALRESAEIYTSMASPT
jgi:tetratricopeptide (TPR) repeat protein